MRRADRGGKTLPLVRKQYIIIKYLFDKKIELVYT